MRLSWRAAKTLSPASTQRAIGILSPGAGEASGAGEALVFSGGFTGHPSAMISPAFATASSAVHADVVDESGSVSTSAGVDRALRPEYQTTSNGRVSSLSPAKSRTLPLNDAFTSSPFVPR